MGSNRLAVICLCVCVACIESASFAQIRVEVTEVPYKEPYAFLGLGVDFGGGQSIELAKGSLSKPETQIGFDLRMQSARRSSIQFEFDMAYRKVDIKDFKDGELQDISMFTGLIGGRYFPLYPTFTIGEDIAVRLNASFVGGWTLGPMDSGIGGFDGRASLGFAFTGVEDASGVTAEIIYRPFSLNGTTYLVKPSWCIRLGFLWGPKNERGF